MARWRYRGPGMRKPGNSGQVSMEYMIVTAFAFLLTVPLIVLFYTQSHQLNDDLRSSQVERIAAEIVDAADEVYYLGEPSKKTIRLYFPENIKSVSFEGNAVIIDVDAGGIDYEVARWSVANLTGTLKPFSGLHNVVVQAGANAVQVSEG